MIWTFLATPLGRRLAFGLALTLAAGYGYRIATNRAYDSGKRDGLLQGLKDAAKQLEEQGRAERARLAGERHAVEDEQAKVEVERRALGEARAQMHAELERGIDALHEELHHAPAEIAKIPASQLDEAIRSRLTELRR